MRIEVLEEVIKVRADFGSGEITPLAFKRKGRIYRVDKVNTRWADREGQNVIYYFSVDCGGNTYELSLRTQDMVWRLERVVLEE
jgi:hypothetical protein